MASALARSLINARTWSRTPQLTRTTGRALSVDTSGPKLHVTAVQPTAQGPAASADQPPLRTNSALDSHVRTNDAERKEVIDEILRVDQAGEAAAVQIYAGQEWVLKGGKIADLLNHMRKGEEVHLDTINRLIAERRVRPTALLPLWEAAGFGMGVATALLGKEAAMACTVAVETTITDHYNAQIRELLKRGYDEKELAAILKQHRDEEMEHHDTAMQNGAQQAPLFGLLSKVISFSCNAAIQVAKRI